jgi:hypothetical protein
MAVIMVSVFPLGREPPVIFSWLTAEGHLGFRCELQDCSPSIGEKVFLI